MNLLTTIEVTQHTSESLPVAGERLRKGDTAFLLPRGERWLAYQFPQRHPYRALYMGMVIENAEPGEPAKIAVHGSLPLTDDTQIYIVVEQVEA